MSQTTDAAEATVEQPEQRDVRALTEAMSVIPHRLTLAKRRGPAWRLPRRNRVRELYRRAGPPGLYLRRRTPPRPERWVQARPPRTL